MSEPNLFVVAAPSGGGKSSLIRALLDQDEHVVLSVSHTTRKPRPGEKDGVHYHFSDEESFRQLIEEDAFLEHAKVFDFHYGTGRKAVEQQLAAGYDVVLDIDWQGARQIRESFPACVTIFIVPPSIETLRQRLTDRGQDSERVIQRRMRDAKAEITHWDEFDHLIINDDFDSALADLQSIIRNDRLALPGQKNRNREILADLLETG